jgi:hypothetical protein
MRCPACDTANPPEAVRCEECGAKLPVRQRRPAPPEEEDDDQPRPARGKSAADEERRPRRRPPEDLEDEDDDYEEEEYERRPRRRRRRRYEEDEEDDEAITTIIPYKNPTALASYYMSFFTLIPALGILLGIASIVLGILGLRYANDHPEAKGTAHSVIGITLSAICIIANPIICYLLLRKFELID